MQNSDKQFHSIQTYLLSKKDKKRSITKIPTFCLGTIIFCILIISASGIHSFYSTGMILQAFTEEKVPMITRNARLSALSQQLLYETERLSTSKTAPERRLAYQRTIEKYNALSSLIEEKSDYKLQRIHLGIIKSTIYELDDLVKMRSELTVQTIQQINKIFIYEQKLNALIKEKRNVDFLNTNDIYSSWILATLDTMNHSTKASTIDVLYRAKLFEKDIRKEIDVIKEISRQLPPVLATDLQHFEEELEELLLGPKGLIHTIRQKIKISRQSANKGNFTRSLVSEFDKENMNMFNHLIDNISSKTEEMSKTIIYAAWMFLSLSIFIIIISFGAILYFHKNLTTRLVNLNNAIQKQILGYTTPIDSTGNDEISDMAKSFIYYVNEVNVREQKLTELATIDSLTGIRNRRSFLEQAEKEILIGRRHNDNISFIMIDVDHFKNVNDTYGHKTGDILLQNLAKSFRKALREEDILGRVGGEEFAVFLTRSKQEFVIEVAERLRTIIDKSYWLIEDNEIHCSVSIGVSHAQGTDDKITNLMHRADVALYKAKETGRNRVVSEPM